ncbi:MAG TPA: AMP-binding protein [Gemmatimonadota bacterium]|nr:AMP-binding protein [Gemmatimonadota bacterium]
MTGPAEGDLSGRSRRDLLALLEPLRGSTRAVRRVEPYRRRGWTADRIATEAERVAAALVTAGVHEGDRVALLLGDGPLWQAAFFGVLRAGAVAVPLDASDEAGSARGTAAELGIVAWCGDTEAADPGLDLPRVELNPASRGSPPPPAAGPLPADAPARPAEIVLTSGTSGVARAVTIRHENLRVVIDALDAGIERYRRWLGLAPRLRIACALPLSHLYGQVLFVFVPTLLDADAILLVPMPAPELARALRRERAFALASVPRTLTLLASWLRARGEGLWGRQGFEDRMARAIGRPWWVRAALFARLRFELGPRLVAVVSGGAALDPATAELYRTLGYVVVQGYGLTETAPLVTLDHPFDSRPGSLGRPLPGVGIRIAADREILVRGPNVAGAVDSEGWLHTGDLGRLDAEGRLWFLGRKDERIVTPAGLNVDPAPIAARLVARPEIADALVLERPWGERGVVCAVLVARPEADPIRAVEGANEGLPDAARVRAWRVWPEADFPRTRTGKPHAAAIREWLAAQAPGNARDPGGGDRIDVLARMVAEIGGVEPTALAPETRLGDALGSLDRVELATRLETTYGVPLPMEAAAFDRRLGDLAADLAAGAAEARESAQEPAETRAPPRVVPEARWRARLPARAFRFLLAQGVLRPLWRSLVAFDADGLDRLAGLDPPFLIAANHLSELDPGAVLFALPPRLSSRVATTAMWEHFERSRAGRVQYALAVAGLDLIPLLQTGDWRPTLRIAGEVADRGGCLLLYPEGERSTDGRLLTFRIGVGILARDLHLPVVPCAASGLLAVLPKGARWPRGIWRRRAPVALRFGDPIPAPRADDDPRAIVEEIRARIGSLLEEARGAAGRY